MLDHMELKPAIRRRFEFIEFAVTWEGSVGRKKLHDQFAISLQQATKDLTAYSEFAPDNLRYDPRQKTYLASRLFTPRFTKGEASEYLSQIEMLDQGRKSEAEIWPTFVPIYAIASSRTRKIEANVLQSLLQAIRDRLVLSANYTSMSSTAGMRRRLVPHAIASDTHRWHVRAYDLEKKRWSDFVISRLTDVNIEGAADPVPPDKRWTEKVEVVLRVDPELEEEKRIAIEREYEMSQGRMILSVSRAMLFYELRHHGFDPRKIGDGDYGQSSFQLDIVNIDEVRVWLGRN